MTTLIDCCNLMGCERSIHAKGLCELHYRQQLYAAKPRSNPCACGCGQLALRRFVNGHNTRLHPGAEQGRRATFSGDSRRRSGVGYVKLHQRHEHRHVAESKLGRPLRSGEIVHHINGNKQDNRPENLEVMTQAEHARLHVVEMLAARKRKLGW